MKITKMIMLFTMMAWITAFPLSDARGAEESNRLSLVEGWAIQSSAKVQAAGDVISDRNFQSAGWYPATVPSTVMGVLVQNKVYPDPFFGMNFRSIPGVNYAVGTNFSRLSMADDSPFKKPWWYRKEFLIPKKESQQIWLHFDGINHRANIWLNGQRIADTRQIAGAYRIYEFNVTNLIAAGQANVLALEIFPQDATDLGINWVDWNPTPPDKNMGIWRDAYITTTGVVALRYPQIVAKLDLPSLDTAHLTVSAELRNTSAKPISATIKGKIEKINFQQTVELAAQEVRQVTFSPDKFLQLNVQRPRLWWPTHVGPQNLYDLDLQVEIVGSLSDRETIRFGIREVTSELNEKNYRVFKINGKPILIRGGGWAPDMFLRPSAEREVAEIRYVKDMNLNAIRFEGKTESRRFLELCDREGILVIAGWCCCDYWELWSKWKDVDYAISAESLLDQLRRIRNHPSVLVWWYGSDNPPNERAEKNYLEMLKAANWPNPHQSSATAKPAKLTGPTGLKMTGPYEYVPPVYWYVDTKNGGAYGFNTETSPGPAVPPVESLRQMLPKEHLWPMDEFWDFHAGGGQFKNIKVFTEALNARFGKASDVEDYARKAQAMAYDGQRAMFEAYARNKYTSTGVIQWMMNNAWPSLIWHLYDYYLRPAGGYFGTKKACEPLHIQYSYDDRSVVVLNGFYREFKNLKATAKIYNLDMAEKFSRQIQVDVASDSSQRVFIIPEIADLSSTYFLRLLLEDSSGKLVSSNFYWLATKSDALEDSKATWYYTPTKTYADFSALSDLPKAEIKVAAKSERKGKEEVCRVTLDNTGRSLAFFVRLKITKGKDGEEILPVLWQDNYVSFLPGEKREITATYGTDQLRGTSPMVILDGWNVAAQVQPVSK